MTLSPDGLKGQREGALGKDQQTHSQGVRWINKCLSLPCILSSHLLPALRSWEARQPVASHTGQQPGPLSRGKRVERSSQGTKGRNPAREGNGCPLSPTPRPFTGSVIELSGYCFSVSNPRCCSLLCNAGAGAGASVLPSGSLFGSVDRSSTGKLGVWEGRRDLLLPVCFWWVSCLSPRPASITQPWLSPQQKQLIPASADVDSGFNFSTACIVPHPGQQYQPASTTPQRSETQLCGGLSPSLETAAAINWVAGPEFLLCGSPHMFYCFQLLSSVSPALRETGSCSRSFAMITSCPLLGTDERSLDPWVIGWRRATHHSKEHNH